MKIASRNCLLLRHRVKTSKLKRVLYLLYYIFIICIIYIILIWYYIIRDVSDGKKRKKLNEMKWNEI